jgi:TPR repeat protein
VAQFNLGVCYANGYGVEKNLQQAFYWHKKAAEQGHAKAQYNLGVCYDKGYGTEKTSNKPSIGIKKRRNRVVFHTSSWAVRYCTVLPTSRSCWRRAIGTSLGSPAIEKVILGQTDYSRAASALKTAGKP